MLEELEDGSTALYFVFNHDGFMIPADPDVATHAKIRHADGRITIIVFTEEAPITEDSVVHE